MQSAVIDIAKPVSPPRRGASFPGVGVVGWLWRIAVGTTLAGLGLALNFAPLSYLGGIVVMGWLFRWMQAVVLRGWYRQSRLSASGSFAGFCEALGAEAPAPRPRWFWQEHVRRNLGRPTGAGSPPSTARILARAMVAPLRSLALNFRIGFQALFTTYLITGWGCLMMWVSWEFGWLNSANKGYEQAFIGPLTGILGSLLLILAMFYVPMAQAHQAATGEARSFFHFRFVWRLIRARITAYLFLAMLTTLLAAVLDILRVVVLSEDFPGNSAATASEGLDYLRGYLFGCTAFLFVSVLLARGLAARIYRSAVLKALRQGSLTRADLHPGLAGWLDRLDLMPPALPAAGGLGRIVAITSRWSYRRLLYAALFGVWLLFVLRFYIGYFLVANGAPGFLSHPLVQFPCFDHVPWHLHNAASW